MVRSSTSSTSSCTSIGSLEDVSVKSGGSPGASTVKFLCSYGGKILPRYPHGKLRYVGGDTRVLAVDGSVSYSELQAKMRDLCGWGSPVNVRYQLPTEDLDALVSVTSDEDLKNLFEEYDHASASKIRAFLLPSPPPSSSTSPTASSKPSSNASASVGRCVHQMAAPVTGAGLIASRLEKAAVAGGGSASTVTTATTTVTATTTTTRPLAAFWCTTATTVNRDGSGSTTAKTDRTCIARRTMSIVAVRTMRNLRFFLDLLLDDDVSEERVTGAATLTAC